jgi:soluble lytic murein transglycosylase
MKKILSLSFLAITFSTYLSCVSQTKERVSLDEEPDRSIASGTTLKTATCEQLIARSKDSGYVLNRLAGLYAQKKCGLNFNLNSLTDTEMKIFSARFEINATYNPKFRIPRPDELVTNKERWNKVWSLYKGNNRAASITALTDLAKSATDMSEKSRALFFLSKLYKKMDKPAEAKKYLEAAAHNDFFSYHALAAHYELGRPLPPISTVLDSPIGSFPFDPALSFLSNDELRLFKALHQNEEYEMLNRTCFAFDKTWVQCANVGIYLAEKDNYYNVLHFSFSYVNDAYKRDLFIRYSHFLFPTAYSEQIAKMTAKTNTPSSLIYAIIKQESCFYPFALSRAPAYGLMQLIPSLGKALANKYNVSGMNETEDLFNADVNIPLGTYELTDQIKRQSGQLTYVGIAYNAGPGKLKQWLALPHSSDMFEFIESIPYEETRNYVKFAARNMLFYQRLADQNKEVYFPKEFIKIVN